MNTHFSAKVQIANQHPFLSVPLY